MPVAIEVQASELATPQEEALPLPNFSRLFSILFLSKLMQLCKNSRRVEFPLSLPLKHRS